MNARLIIWRLSKDDSNECTIVIKIHSSIMVNTLEKNNHSQIDSW